MARAPSISLKTMQNTTFLVLLRPIFSPKMKIAPPMGLAIRRCEGLKLVRKTDWIWVKTFLVFFGDHPILARKTAEIPVKTFFLFGDHLSLNKKTTQTDQRSSKIWVKIVWCFFQYPKQPPPLKQAPGYAPVFSRGGVEDTRLKAKDTKKLRGQGQGKPFRGQTLSRPRTGMLEAKAKDQGHRRKCSP